MEIKGFTLPEPTVQVAEGHAVDFIIETIMREEPGTVTLVPTGPLTNIALAVRKEPRIVERVAEVVLMGGGVHVGNWSATAEFNIIIDPEAAHIVFNEPWPVVMVGLDLTHQALATREIEAEFKALALPWATSWWACSATLGSLTRRPRALTIRRCTIRARWPTSSTPTW